MNNVPGGVRRPYLSPDDEMHIRAQLPSRVKEFALYHMDGPVDWMDLWNGVQKMGEERALERLQQANAEIHASSYSRS